MGLARTLRCLLVALGAVPWTGSTPHALRIPAAQEAADPWSVAREPLIAELVPRLEDLAGWCGDKKLFSARAEVYRTLIAFAPDHAAARRALGYRKTRDGWEEPRRPRETRDFDPDALAELEEHRRAAIEPFVAAARDYLDARGDAAPPELVRAVQDDVLLVDPANAEIRTQRGEVLCGGIWVLAETAGLAERLAFLIRTVSEGLSEAPPPEPTEPNAIESSLGVEWSYSLATPLFRIHGTGDVQEGIDCARAVYAAWNLFNQALGTRTRLGFATTFYLLADAQDRIALLDNHPRLDPEQRGFLRNTDGGAIRGSSDFVHWAASPARRLDAAVRFAVARMLLDAFGIGDEIGWFYECAGVYFTHAALGTRYTWFLTPASTRRASDVSLRLRLTGAKADWLKEARALDEKGTLPSLGDTLGKPLADVSPPELLTGYLLTVYLIEGAPAKAPDFLRRIGRRRRPEAEALEQVYGLSVEGMDARLRRWLRERLDGPGAG